MVELSIHWQEDKYSIEGYDSEEDKLAERELKRLITFEESVLPIQTKEKDLINMIRIGKAFV